MTTTIRGTDNSAAAPALTGNDSDTGVYFPAANKLGLVTGGTERVIVDDSGNVGVGTGTPAVALDVVGQVRASTGILFGTDTAAANALDDYEEGTWTATLTGSTAAPTTPVTVTGRYVKIGKLVYVNATFSGVNTSGASGDVRITGLPFACATGGRSQGAIMLFNFPFTAGYTDIVSRVNNGATHIEIFQNGSNVSALIMPMSAGSNKYVGVSQCYEVA